MYITVPSAVSEALHEGDSELEVNHLLEILFTWQDERNGAFHSGLSATA